MLAYRKKNNKIVELLEYGNEEQLEQFPNFIATNKEIVQNHLGEFVFADELDTEAENAFQFQQANELKLNELKSARDAEELSPVSYGGYEWDFDDKAQQRINGAIIALADGGELTWTSADNQEIKRVNANDLRNVIKAAAIRSNAVHVKYRELKALVEQAETKEQVEAVVW